MRAGASVVDPKSDNLPLGPTTTLQIDEDTQFTFDATADGRATNHRVVRRRTDAP